MAKKIINYKGKCKTAFTLIELLVVIAIIALLLSILMPALTAVKKQARAVMCSSNLKQLGLAVHTFHDSFGALPPAHTADFDGTENHVNCRSGISNSLSLSAQCEILKLIGRKHER